MAVVTQYCNQVSIHLTHFVPLWIFFSDSFVEFINVDLFDLDINMYSMRCIFGVLCEVYTN